MKKLLFLIPLGLAGILASCQQELEPSANVDSQVAEATFVEPEPDSLLVNTYELNRVIGKYAKAVGMPVSRSAADEVLTVNDDEGTPVLYIVNKANNGGFFIVSARKNASPLLAYNEDGNFNYEALKSSDSDHPMLTWIENIKNAILADELADSVAADTWKSFEVLSPEKLAVKSRAIDDGEFSRLHAMMANKMAEWSADPETKVYTFEEFRIAYPDKAAYYSEVLPGGMIYLGYYEDYERLTLFVEKNETTYSSTSTDETYSTIKWDQNIPLYRDATNSWNQSFPTYIDKYGRTCYFPAGCCTVAAGQIMRITRHPSYFSWDAMPLQTPTKTTSDLLYDIASKSSPNYKFNETTGSPETGIKLPNLAKTLQGYGYVAEHMDFNESKIITPAIISSKLTKLDNTIAYHAWALLNTRYFRTERTLSCWTFPRSGVFSETDKTLLTAEDSGKMRYANWGWSGDGNCWISNVRFACPENSTSAESIGMIIKVYPK